jgi:polyribonucleotide nucleotidyltransferase
MRVVRMKPAAGETRLERRFEVRQLVRFDERAAGVKDFGAFVECLPGKEGLCHISELADFRVRRTEDVVKMGDSITVKCIGIDERSKKVRLSRKAALAELEAQKDAPAAEAPATEEPKAE